MFRSIWPQTQRLFKILITFSVTTFSLKLLAEWRPNILSWYWENLVLVVVVVIESNCLYCTTRNSDTKLGLPLICQTIPHFHSSWIKPQVKNNKEFMIGQKCDIGLALSDYPTLHRVMALVTLRTQFLILRSWLHWSFKTDKTSPCRMSVINKLPVS